MYIYIYTYMRENLRRCRTFSRASMGIREWKIKGGGEGGRVRIERIGKRRRVTEKSGVKYSDERGIIKNSSTTFALERISRTDTYA